MLVRMAIIILLTTIHENQYKIVLLKKKKMIKKVARFMVGRINKKEKYADLVIECKHVNLYTPLDVKFILLLLYHRCRNLRNRRSINPRSSFSQKRNISVTVQCLVKNGIVLSLEAFVKRES